MINRAIIAGLLVLGAFAAFACSGPNAPIANTATRRADAREADIPRLKDSLVPFFRPMTVREGDWLESHQESGQTFDEYVDSGPMLPAETRKTIYIQPIGSFSADQRRVMTQTADYMRAFYNLPVQVKPEKPLGIIPKTMSRLRYPNNRQIRTSHFLETLPKMLPADAAAFICFTNFDLYPEDTWNFVFGQASLDDRVGVWSLYRLVPKGKKQSDSRLFVSRTLKIAVHETGHMFSMRHCTKYECLMSGTNHLDETDRRPLDTCPECTAKIAWAMGYDLSDRYKNLEAFFAKQGWKAEQSEMARKRDAIVKAQTR